MPVVGGTSDAYGYDYSAGVWRALSVDSNGNLNTNGSGTVTPPVAMVGPWLSLGLTNIQHS